MSRPASSLIPSVDGVALGVLPGTYLAQPKSWGALLLLKHVVGGHFFAVGATGLEPAALFRRTDL